MLASVHHVPVGYGSSLFFSPVPHRGEVDERRLAHGFEDSKQGTQSDQGCKVFGHCMESECSAPKDNGTSEVFGNGEALNEAICGVFDKENSDVDTCGQPRELTLVSSGHEERLKNAPAAQLDEYPF